MSKEEIRFSIDYGHSLTVMPMSEFARWAEELGYDGITMGGSGVAERASTLWWPCLRLLL